MQCENHTCRKTIVNEEEEGLTCAYCRDPLYCSRKCQAMDWVRHKCPNALDTPTVDSALFVPYHFEDLLCQEQVAQLDARDKVHQSYSIRSVSQDMRVEHRIQESLIASQTDFIQTESAQRGSIPLEEEMGTRYTMELSFNDSSEHLLEGSIPQNLIFPSNESNVQAKLLGGGRIQADSNATTRWNKIAAASSSSSNLKSFAIQPEGLIYWQNNLSINMPLKGIATVALDDDLYLEAPYDFSVDCKMSKLVKSNYEVQLVNKQIAPSPLVKSIRASDANTTVILTALVGQENATLLDVEVREGSAPLESEISKVLLDCDPNNVNHMVGLAMGLELLAASNDQFQELADTLGDFARRKMDNPSLNASPEIASAVTEAVEALHENFIGEGWLAKRWKRFKEWTGDAKSAVQKAADVRAVEKIAMRIKKNVDLTQSEKESRLQELYDEQLRKAQKDQTQNEESANQFILSAMKVFKVARREMKESSAIVLSKRPEQINVMRVLAKEKSGIKDNLRQLLREK